MKYFFCLFLLVGFCAPLAAQEISAAAQGESYGQSKSIAVIPSETPGIHEFSFWGGYSFHSTRGVWGKTSGTQLGIGGIRYNRKLLLLFKKSLLEYVTELNFFARYTSPQFSEEATETEISGFGLTPLGFQLNWNRNNPIQPFFKSSTGFMYLTEPFPDERGVKFNFTLEIGSGIEFVLTRHASLLIGYKYHHMSNGEFGSVNPGVDSNVFYGAITLF